MKLTIIDMKKHTQYLKRLNACSEAIEWAEQYPTLQQAWDNCERGDWMLWLAGKQSGEPGTDKRRKLVLCACDCARLSLKHVPENEKRPLRAIETAEAWARKETGVSLDDVKVAADVDYATAITYTTDAAAGAEDAADYAVDAVDAVDATNAAAGAADAAADAAGAAARRETLKKCADIARKHYPKIRMIKL